MATINVPTGEVFEFGTTSDDTITITDALDYATGEDLDGNGGEDSLTLEGSDLATLLTGANASVAFDADTGVWVLDDDTTGGDDATISNGIQSITFNDGATLVGGTASSGFLNPGSVNADGTTLALATINTYEFDGAALTADTFTATSIVSVDGQEIATAGSNFTNTDGAFTITGATGLQFVANTAAIAALGNVGDAVTFSYEVVLADTDGNTQTVTVTFDATVPFTTGDDEAFADAAGEAIDETATEAAGDDTFNGAEGNDTLTAGAGNDTLLGANGDDVLVGGADDDFLRGGNGADTISAASGENNLGGGAGIDSITGGSDDDTIFGGVGDDVLLDGGAGNDVINGGSGADTLTGSAGDDTLRGGDGDDVLNGTSGSNELRGGAGDDTVNGGTGNDQIFVSLGDDSLTGGTGDDTFVLRDDSGTTTIADFGTGDDQLDVSGIGLADLDAVLAIAFETDAGVTIAIDEDTSVVLTGLNLADLSNADFDFA
ncbi:Hemolysin-type calcium-binding repeat-containing protein [Epibacterium ulvae]|uniref:Hemolysin-type calcium-binding repeat-containing protein n=1 Tax=Epibacterium ulvae TaxID=1156985 RepID=A0A1G5RF61_9RHOB|nr:calcium-binding protein [Epibacterium ulvae]SCZ71919.1 Hemolysin-type calcium-binding repeat-containing protein [Epibacterium ulvae]